MKRVSLRCSRSGDIDATSSFQTTLFHEGVSIDTVFMLSGEFDVSLEAALLNVVSNCEADVAASFGNSVLINLMPSKLLTALSISARNTKKKSRRSGVSLKHGRQER
jgi:hypothetical protein